MDETLEQNLEEKRKLMESREIHGAGVENLSKAKGRFENPQEEAEIVREAVDIQRSDADKKRVQKTFNKVGLSVVQWCCDCTETSVLERRYRRRSTPRLCHMRENCVSGRKSLCQ